MPSKSNPERTGGGDWGAAATAGDAWKAGGGAKKRDLCKSVWDQRMARIKQKMPEKAKTNAARAWIFLPFIRFALKRLRINPHLDLDYTAPPPIRQQKFSKTGEENG